MNSGVPPRTHLRIKPFRVEAMRLPRVRFTIRRMMVGVAIIAGLLWASYRIRVWRDRQGFCVYQAEAHAECAKRDLMVAEFAERLPTRPRLSLRRCILRFTADSPEIDDVFKPVSPADRRQKAAYHDSLKTQFERAARYPWFSVPSTPPIEKGDGID